MQEINLVPYEVDNNISIPKGANESYIRKDNGYGSLVNKLHLIKLVGVNGGELSPSDVGQFRKHKATTFVELCTAIGHGAHEYDVEDFIYCKKMDYPLNSMITLRRFPKPCTDNIFDSHNQAEPDVARMVTFMDQETNKMEDILGFSYSMKWKELTSEMEQASSIGDQSGFSGLSKKVMSFIDPGLAQNNLRGENKLNYDPKHDQNKVYGPVDSITQTNIRDVGLEFQKEFDLVFEYDLKSWNGRTPEFAMKDLIANILATTYNNAKFWGGSRYWVGERPSKFTQHMQYMNPDSIDEFLTGAYNDLKAAVAAFSTKGSAIKQLKNVLSNGLAIGLGKILDNVGRPSILVMNSLLSGEPTGFWHVTVGHPDNPTMCIGNLIMTGVEFKFPTDSMSLGDFPTKLQVNVKLKNGMPKDKAGVEMMFNQGRKRIYYNPTHVNREKNNNKVSRRTRRFYGFEDDKAINEALDTVFDFVGETSIKIKNSFASNDIGPQEFNPNINNNQDASNYNIIQTTATPLNNTVTV